ncbi:MAG TPA: hypothetical protein VNT79_18175, partial [Phycisphaerae bacterium]|nr:hypothetical protein [Phycisphaerae bacterium]
ATVMTLAIGGLRRRSDVFGIAGLLKENTQNLTYTKLTNRSQQEIQVSIYGQREYPLDAQDVAARLLLKFDDSDLPDEDDTFAEARMSQRRREAAQFGLSINPPSEADAASIIEFAGRIHDVKGW